MVSAPVLHTPAEAADLLKVRESWLRKKAAARAIPCTFLGKHLRFSDDDIAEIVRSGARKPKGATPSMRTRSLRQESRGIRLHEEEGETHAMAYAQRHGRGWRARYQKPDGTVGSESGFETKSAALDWANEQELFPKLGHRTPR